MTKLNWVQKVLFSINAVFAALLLMVINVYDLAPSQTGYLYLLPLGFPILFGVNAIFCLWWLVNKKIHVLLPILMLCWAYPLSSQWISYNISSGDTVAKDVKLMTFNVRRFNEFNWIKDRDVTHQILHYIQDENPDIITFQEFVNNPQNNEYQIKMLRKMGYNYFKLEPRGQSGMDKQYFGLATFSKYPISNFKNGYDYKRNGKSVKSAYLSTTIKFKTKSVTIINCHLRSLKFVKEDYQFVENVSDSEDKEALYKSKSILSKVLHAGKQREKEVMHLFAQVQATTTPLIITGDFNEPPTSFAYTQLKRTLFDPFDAYGFGPQPTFDGISNLPGLRLDHILHNKQVTSTSYCTGPSGLSDHRPVITTFHFSE